MIFAIILGIKSVQTKNSRTKVFPTKIIRASKKYLKEERKSESLLLNTNLRLSEKFTQALTMREAMLETRIPCK